MPGKKDAEANLRDERSEGISTGRASSPILRIEYGP